MTSGAVALPLARRRRRRRPTRREIEALLLMLVDTFIVLSDVVSFLVDASWFWRASNFVLAIVFTRFVLNSWKIVWNYIKNGCEDDD
jgi:hypothetical protein